MSVNSQKFNGKPACAEKPVAFPAEMTCPHCGALVEIWNDEYEASCPLCRKTVYREESW
ncbi:MAG: hypothetical protein HZA16_13295 [Nitrospirae bacterium]|nr:hypothetical protein [Nitrospirota bacterium]